MAKKAGNEVQSGKKGYLLHKKGVAPGEGFNVSIEQEMGGLLYDGFEAGEFNDKNPDGPDWPSSAKGKAE